MRPRKKLTETSIRFLWEFAQLIKKLSRCIVSVSFAMLCSKKMPPKSRPTFRTADYLSLNLPATIIRIRHKHTWIIDLLNGLYRRGSLRALLPVANKPRLTCCRRRRYFEHSATKVAPFYGRCRNKRAYYYYCDVFLFGLVHLDSIVCHISILELRVFGDVRARGIG